MTPRSFSNYSWQRIFSIAAALASEDQCTITPFLTESRDKKPFWEQIPVLESCPQ